MATSLYSALLVLFVLPWSSYDSPVPLINGGVVPGSISVLGEQDCYSFFANANEGIQLSVPDISLGPFRPRIEVIDPSGMSVGSVFNNNVALFRFPAPATGTYTFLVEDVSSTNTGSYEVHFTRAPGADELGRLSNGVPMQQEITLGDLDSWTFDGVRGQTPTISMSDINSDSLTPHMTLYDPLGAVVLMPVDGDDKATLRPTLDATGTYTLVVRDTGGTFLFGTGSYSIVVDGIPAAPVPIPWFGPAGLAVLVTCFGVLLLRK